MISDFLQENKNYFPELENFANNIFDKVKQNNRTRYVALCEFMKSEYGITVIDIIPEEGKPFSKLRTWTLNGFCSANAAELNKISE
mgnify:CR=1 FL=1